MAQARTETKEEHMSSDNKCRPEIHYPCPWQYRLIGEDEAAMRAALSWSPVGTGRGRAMGVAGVIVCEFCY